MVEANSTPMENAQSRPPAAKPPIPARVGHGLLNFLSSVRLAVILLILLAVVSIIGTVLFQGEDTKENTRLFTNATWWVYGKLGMVPADDHGEATHAKLQALQKSAQEWGVKLTNWSSSIGFDRLYHTWYFNLMLALLALNLIVCSLKHWPHTRRFFSHPKRTLEGEGAAGIPLHREFAVRSGAPDAASRALAALARKGYRAGLTDSGGASHLFSQKGIWGRLGVYLVHLSILIVMLGAVIGLRYGKKGFVAIEEGSTIGEVDLRGSGGTWKLPFQVRCDNFEVSYYEGGRRPKDYKSELSVLDAKGKEVLKKTIEVNSPLIYQGIYFYQSSYGETGKAGRIKLRLSSPALAGKPVEYWLTMDREVAVPELGLKARVLRDPRGRPLFFPDIEFQGNRPVNKSNQPANPAAYFRFTTEDGRSFDSWLLRYFPEYTGLGAAPFKAEFTDYQGHEYTGLQVAYDPGTWVVWLGCSLMMVGIFIAFFIPHKRIWVKLAPGPRGLTAWVAGSTNRNRSTFDEEFERVFAAVKESLAS